MSYGSIKFKILTFEIIDISKDDININKINMCDEVVYNIYFNQIIYITYSIDNHVEKAVHNMYVSHSFVYKKIDNNLIVLPIDANYMYIDTKLNFSIVYGFFYISTNNESDHNLNKLHLEDIDYEHNINKSNYTYIDIKKEFL